MAGVSLADLSGMLQSRGSSLMDLINSGAGPLAQAQGGMTPQQAFQAAADPDAVMNSPVAGFAGMTGGTNARALMDLQRRIATGVEGLSGEAKYAALRDIASQLQGAVPSAGANMVPQDVSWMRALMQRLADARLNPMQYK